jgi:hypothetical protein
MVSVWRLLVPFVGGGCAGTLLLALMRNPERASDTVVQGSMNPR